MKAELSYNGLLELKLYNSWIVFCENTLHVCFL